MLTRILAPPFFARQDTKRQMRFALASVVANVVLGVGLFLGLRAMGHPGFVGLAIATSAAAWVNVILLAGALLKEKDLTPAPSFVSRMFRIVIATLMMSAIVAVAASNRELIEAPFAAVRCLGGRAKLAVLATSSSGFLIFVAFAFALRAITPREILQRPAPSASGSCRGRRLAAGLDG